VKAHKNGHLSLVKWIDSLSETRKST
jgi:hypothetical protein